MEDFFNRTEKRVNRFFWVFLVVNIVWWLACMTGLFFLGKAAIEWLNRN